MNLEMMLKFMILENIQGFSRNQKDAGKQNKWSCKKNEDLINKNEKANRIGNN